VKFLNQRQIAVGAGKFVKTFARQQRLSTKIKISH